MALREEIGQHGAAITDLSKWKLVAVAALAVAGLGWSDIRPASRTGLILLYSVGFLCAYIDTLMYQKNTAIHLLASYFRGYRGSNQELLELRAYEEYVNAFRLTKGVYFMSYRWPQFIYSLLFSIGLPVLGHLKYAVEPDGTLLLAALAVAINVVLFVVYGSHRRRLITKTRDLFEEELPVLPK